MDFLTIYFTKPEASRVIASAEQTTKTSWSKSSCHFVQVVNFLVPQASQMYSLAKIHFQWKTDALSKRWALKDK